MSKPVWDAVQAYLTANWTATEILIINNVENGQQFDDFIAADIVDLEEVQRSFGAPGANTYRERGEIMIHMFVSAANGMDNLNTYAESLKTLFRGKKFSGVQCQAATGPTEELTEQKGLFYRAIVTVPYYYDIIGG